MRGMSASIRSTEGTAMRTLLTPEELAERWKMGRKTLANWRSARIGPPYIKVNGSIRYDEDAAEKWLTSQEHDLGAARPDEPSNARRRPGSPPRSRRHQRDHPSHHQAGRSGSG